jgi:hypothetical protein
MSYKNEETQAFNDLQISDSLEKFITDLPDRYDKGEIDKKIEERVEKDWNLFTQGLKKENRVVRKRLVYFSVTIAASVSLFIGAAFVSPSIAKIAAAIPYLNLVFEKKVDAKPLISEITETLFENGYSPSNIVVSVNNTKKEVTVAVLDTEEYFEQVRKPLQSMVEDIIEAQNHRFKVKMINEPEVGEFFKESMQDPSQDDELDQVSLIVGEVLKSYGYSQAGVGVRIGRIDLENIPNTETRIEEIKAQIVEALRNEQKGEYEVKAHLYVPEASDRSGKFMPIYHTIVEGLTAKTEHYKVDSVGFSSKKDHFYMEVRTTVPSDYRDIDEVVTKLEQTIQEFLNSAEIQQQIQGEPYKVVITSTDEKELKVIQN